VAVTILVIENHRYAVDADADRFAARSANPQPPASNTLSRDTTASETPGTPPLRIMVFTAALTPRGGVPTAIVSPIPPGSVPVVLMASPVSPADSPGTVVAVLRFRTIMDI
jgi:hypothetical protein